MNSSSIKNCKEEQRKGVPLIERDLKCTSKMTSFFQLLKESIKNIMKQGYEHGLISEDNKELKFIVFRYEYLQIKFCDVWDLHQNNMHWRREEYR